MIREPVPHSDVHGILNVSKPAGKTSFQVVALVRRWSGVRKVGHAGTLDPQATGVLLVCLGQATRVVEYLAAATKSYLAQVELGVSTDTYDASGRVVGGGDPSSITRQQVETVLSTLTGAIWQTPPLYSALKLRGKRLYELARSGQQVELAPRQVNISRLEVAEWDPPRFSLRIECGKGTYIRSVAHDLGQALGCGAHLASLVRLRVGAFHIEDALDLSQLETAFVSPCWTRLLYPLDKALEGLEAVVVDAETERGILNGQSVALDTAQDIAGPPIRVYTLDRRFIAVLGFDRETKLWHPDKVFLPTPAADVARGQ